MLFIVNLFNFIVKILYYYYEYVSKLYVIKIIELKLYYDDDVDDEGKWMNE